MGNVYSETLVELTLDEMKNCVKNGSYIIIQREENQHFIDEYLITESKQRDILLSIKKENYSASEPSDKIPGSYVHIFGKKMCLPDSQGHDKALNLYIKFEIIDRPQLKRTVFISFHEELYPLTFPFQT